MIESLIDKMLSPFGELYPFEIPDNVTGSAIAYRRIGNRVVTKYHSMNYQITEALFYVVRQESGYLTLCDDNTFISGVTKYNSENLISVRFDGYEDFKTNTGRFERQYRLIVRHKETI